MNPDLSYMTASQRLAAYMQDSTLSKAPEPTKPVSLRIPEELIARVDVIAKRANMSRNQACCYLLSAGIDATLLEIKDEQVQESIHTNIKSAQPDSEAE